MGEVSYWVRDLTLSRHKKPLSNLGQGLLSGKLTQTIAATGLSIRTMMSSSPSM